MEKKLTRIPSEAVLGGVAAGMAHYFNIDRTIIRVLWVVALLLPIPPTFFWTAVIYIVLWAALPEGTPGFNTPTNPYDHPPAPSRPIPGLPVRLRAIPRPAPRVQAFFPGAPIPIVLLKSLESFCWVSGLFCCWMNSPTGTGCESMYGRLP
ncbi:PspC domain-containing protein [Salmonirosea aquatica]|uniref:PspC domain-containing protein n=1 Tax=Salmonirosea aquatica TaxID=2654236 RepID=A0A7C9FAE6_9BACT|nr:PspC domain-containing protein [Cytophagaceae bacterium SJW1-29]